MGRVPKISLPRAAVVLAVTAAGIGQGVAFAAPAITPVHVTCGEVITTSIIVANNLTCSGNALSVQADDVTLDLGGHTIRGGGSGVGVEIADFNNPDITGVTITNGTIAQFGTAVQLFNADGATLSSLTLNNNSGTTKPVIDTGRSPITNELLITNTHITNTTGYVIFASINVGPTTFSNTHITGGTVFFSQSAGPTFSGDTFSTAAVTLNVEGDTTITGSKFVGSPVVNNGFGFGNDVFKDNTFSGAATALTLQDVPTQQVDGNTFSNNDIGVSVSDSPGDIISGNTFSHNTTAGIYYVDDSGPLGSGSLNVSDNIAKYNGTSPDGALDPGGQPVAGGIYLYTAHGGATINNNTTAHNGGYGIYANPGSGVNTASGNVSTGDANQCFPLSTCTY